jgi:nitrite reductase/ring-hydroxylating ferredoxin subunit
VIQNPARPEPGTRICAIADLADPGSRGFIFRRDDKLFLGFVVRAGDIVRGYEDRCPHAGMPLAMAADRYLTREGDLILCASHCALFRLDDGLCVGGPCAGARLGPWPVEVRGGEVFAA